MSLIYGTGKSNSLIHIPEDIKVETNPTGVRVKGTGTTFNNGVVSNFSLGNYLILEKNFNFVSKPWEMVIKCSFTTFNDRIRLVGSLNKVALFVLGFANTTGTIYLWASSNGSSWNVSNAVASKAPLQLNTEYYIKIAWSGTAYTVDYSTNNIDYNNLITVNSSVALLDDVNFVLGTNYDGTQYFNGSIDLNECYIKNGNDIVWHGGNGKFILKQGSKVWYPDGLDEEGNKKFSYLTVEKDIESNHSLTNDWTGYILLSTDGKTLYVGSNVESGETASETALRFYNIVENKFTDLADVNKDLCLPIAYVNSSSHGISYIHNIFNGCGFVGKEAYILPNVKGLIPSGFNEDGTCKNIATTITDVRTYSCIASHELTMGNDYASQGNMEYNKSTNYMIKTTINPNDIRYEIPIAKMTMNTEKTLVTAMEAYPLRNYNNSYHNINEIYYGVGKSNCLTYIDNDIKVEINPMNVSFVGTPTVNNGIASGFSTTSRLDFNGTKIVSENDLKSFEIKVKINSGSLATTNGRIINASGGADSKLGFYIEISSNNIAFVFYNGTLPYFNCRALLNPTPNTDYYLKWEYDGTNIKGYNSTDGITYNLVDDVTPPYKLYFNTTSFGIGNRPADMTAVCVFNGTVDLNNSYIIINDEMWWKGGDGSITLKAGSKIYNPNGDFNILENDIKMLNYNSSSSQLICCATYNEDGTISNGMAVTDNSKCMISDSEPAWSDITPRRFWFDKLNKKLYTYAPSSSEKSAECSLPFACVTSESGKGITSIKNIFNGFGYIGKLQYVLPNVKYSIPNGFNEDSTYKVINKEIKNIVYHDDTADITGTWNKVMQLDDNCSYTSSNVYYNQVEQPSFVENSNQIWYNPKTNKMFYYRNSSSNGYRNYAKMNDYTITNGFITSWTPPVVIENNEVSKIKEVYYGVGKSNCLTYIPEDVKYKLDPLNINRIGAPSIEMGVASNFSTTNYILTPNSVNLNTVNSFEIVICFQGNAGSIIQQNSNQPYSIAITPTLFLIRLTDGTTWTRITPNELPNDGNTKLWYKLVFNGNQYIAYTSTDGNQYNEVARLENSTKIISSNQPFVIGTNDIHTDPFQGTIFLNESYIKINDEMWWKGATGSITILKGSKVWYPDGTYEILDSDVVHGTYFNGPNLLTFCYNTQYKNIGGSTWNNTYCGNTAPASPANSQYWLNLTDKKMRRYTGTNTWTEGYSLPLFVSKSCNSIDQIFNGVGYFANVQYTLPNIKCSFANGLTEDNLYKSIDFTPSQIIWNEYNYKAPNQQANITLNNGCWRTAKSEISETEPVKEAFKIWYNPKTNLTYYLGDNVASNWQQVNLFQIVQNINTDDTFKVVDMTIAPIKNINSVIKIK